MTHANPLVSIIIPSYNSAHLLPRCLDSILSQDYAAKEIIVVDGGSKDQTVEVIKTYAQQYPFVKWISEKDKGVYDAMNKGIGMAAGEWLYFIGCDDVLFNDQVLSEVFEGKDLRRVDMLYGNVEFLHSGRIYNGSYSYEKVLMRGNICHQAIFYRKDVFQKLGVYDISCRIYADHDFNIRCFSEKSIRTHYIPTVVAVYNEEDGLSANHKEDVIFAGKQHAYFSRYNRTPRRLFKRAYQKLRSVVKI